jgi:SSS family solute:Na+ symporter
MLITLVLIVVLMAIITSIRPLKEARVLPVRQNMDMRTSPLVLICGIAVIAAVAAFFVIFR